MKAILKFIAKILVLTILLVGTYYFFMYRLSKGFVDDNYYKFTHASHSLIVGLSRAHNGIAPQVLDSALEGTAYQSGFLNFAFEKSQSPYGEVYLQAIEKKLLPQTEKGIFILGVSPGSFTAPIGFGDNQKEIYKFDKKMLVGKVGELNSDPNFEYIRKAYAGSLYRAIFPYDNRITTTFHKNGWEEFTLSAKGYEVSEEEIKLWTEQTIKGYELVLKLKPEKVSGYRLEYFKKTIGFLKNHGKVYIVRLPVAPAVLEREGEWWQDFDEEMNKIALQYGVPYLNYSAHTEFMTYDGSHLISEDAKAFTKTVATTIKKGY